jgi:hypothetical protein
MNLTMPVSLANLGKLFSQSLNYQKAVINRVLTTLGSYDNSRREQERTKSYAMSAAV